jgi:hypothetical protein
LGSKRSRCARCPACSHSGALQAQRRIGTLGSARWLTWDLSSVYLGSVGEHAPLRWALRAYWRLVLAVLAAFARGARLTEPPETR